MRRKHAKRQRDAYRVFVEAGMIDTDDEFRDSLKASKWGIGDEDFQAKVRELHTDMALVKADSLKINRDDV